MPRPLALPTTLALAAALVATPLAAQQPGAAAGALRLQPSGRATTEVTLGRGGTPRIRIDYGQPHARGRAIIGGAEVPYDQVWRTGANAATTLTTDVDLRIGNARVPRGTYTLFTLPSRSGWKLIINKQTGQWGTEYNAGQDLARVDMRVRALRDPQESFTMWLAPAAGAAPRGTLRLAWVGTEASVDWEVVQ
jgi:hypothetical protein